MTTVTIHEAKTHLSRWINRVLSGEDVVIARGKVPVVKLTPIQNSGKNRRIGGKPNLVVRMDKNFDAPLDDFREYME